nr:hypothetical protein [Candidatus Sigynarchaeota archaeon]
MSESIEIDSDWIKNSLKSTFNEVLQKNKQEWTGKGWVLSEPIVRQFTGNNKFLALSIIFGFYNSFEIAEDPTEGTLHICWDAAMVAIKDQRLFFRKIGFTSPCGSLHDMEVKISKFLLENMSILICSKYPAKLKVTGNSPFPPYMIRMHLDTARKLFEGALMQDVFGGYAIIVQDKEDLVPAYTWFDSETKSEVNSTVLFLRYPREIVTFPEVTLNKDEIQDWNEINALDENLNTEVEIAQATPLDSFKTTLTEETINSINKLKKAGLTSLIRFFPQAPEELVRHQLRI